MRVPCTVRESLFTQLIRRVSNVRWDRALARTAFYIANATLHATNGVGQCEGGVSMRHFETNSEILFQVNKVFKKYRVAWGKNFLLMLKDTLCLIRAGTNALVSSPARTIDQERMGGQESTQEAAPRPLL